MYLNRRSFLSISAMSALAACGGRAPELVEPELIGGIPVDQIVEGYGVLEDGEYTLPPIDPQYLQGVNRRAHVAYAGAASPGTIVIDRHAKFLFLVEEGGMAWRYPIAVGRAGVSLNNPAVISLKREWPGWTPTANMLRRQPEVYGPFAAGVPGGLASPLGARALYLFQNGRDTHFRIHGTNDAASIGNSGSAGCIRLFNHDIIDLYEKVPRGTRVVFRSYADSVRLEGEEIANRGVELPPTIVDPESIYGATDVDDEADEAESTDPAANDPLGSATISGS